MYRGVCLGHTTGASRADCPENRGATMGRVGDFSKSTIDEGFERQGDRCAWCYEPFSEYDKVEAHHIESVEAGLAQGKTAEEIGALDNCAIVHANSPVFG